MVSLFLGIEIRSIFLVDIYSSSHNHGSGKWVPPILVSFHLVQFSTSMIMGERDRKGIYIYIDL